MRKVLLSLVVLLVLMVGAVEANPTEPDFRNSYFGMSRRDVILSEAQLPSRDHVDSSGTGIMQFGHFDEGDLIDHLDRNKLYNVWHEAWYFFKEDHLVEGALRMNHPRGGFNYTKLYDLMGEWLERQYGEGVYEEMWEEGQLEGSLDGHLYLGEVERQTTWTDGAIKVSLRQGLTSRFIPQTLETFVVYAPADG